VKQPDKKKSEDNLHRESVKSGCKKEGGRGKGKSKEIKNRVFASQYFPVWGITCCLGT